jgi:putative peptide maturation dehydrogenase
VDAGRDVARTVVNIRRTANASFSLEDEYALDPTALMLGRLPVAATRGRITALALLTGQQYTIDEREWAVLLTVPADRWVATEGFDSELIAGLVDKALLITDAADATARRLRDREDALAETAWNPFAALYHFSTQWSGVEIEDAGAEAAELAFGTQAAVGDLVARYGTPPPALPHLASEPAVRLAGRPRDGEFFRTLLQRQTTRAFDRERSLSLDDLDTVLRYVFGSHGYASRVDGVVCIKRTSPSGGGLHPVDVYPMVIDVAGVPAGIYHYNGDDHSLAPVLTADPASIRERASSFMCGQRYFADAQVVFLLTARFSRNHWKYRRHPRAYAGMLMDVGHLCQTLYLVSAELGLGAFVTHAINGRDIEGLLGVDGVREGALAMCGCGHRAGPSPLDFSFTEDPPPGPR